MTRGSWNWNKIINIVPKDMCKKIIVLKTLFPITNGFFFFLLEPYSRWFLFYEIYLWVDVSPKLFEIIYHSHIFKKNHKLERVKCAKYFLLKIAHVKWLTNEERFVKISFDDTYLKRLNACDSICILWEIVNT